MQYVDTHDKTTVNNKSQLLKQSWAFRVTSNMQIGLVMILGASPYLYSGKCLSHIHKIYSQIFDRQKNVKSSQSHTGPKGGADLHSPQMDNSSRCETTASASHGAPVYSPDFV